MKALVYTGKKLKYVSDHPEPELDEWDVLIKVKACGICGTDMAIVNGTLPTPVPIIPGHEISGIIEAVGKEVSKRENIIGKPVTAEINTNTCGKCSFCISGAPTQCPERKALGIDVDGGFAEHIVVHRDLVHELPRNLDFREATLIEPLAAAIQTFERMPLVQSDDYVVILGAGKLSLLILQVIKALYDWPLILVLGHHDYKLQLAGKLGAFKTLNTRKMTEKDIIKAVNEFSDERGANIVIEATGNPHAIREAILMTRPRGKIGLKSTHGESVPFDMTTAVVKEIDFYTSRCGPFEKAIDLIRKNKIKLKELISSVFPLSRGIEAFKMMDERRDSIIKIVLEINRE
ncbi:MAG: zinc-binding dehydrogenase [Candidatus Hodarchaeota archaeon]